MGNVCQRERDGSRSDPERHETQSTLDRLFHPSTMRPRLTRSSSIGGQACLIPRRALEYPRMPQLTRRRSSDEAAIAVK
jgi:hypothetical protein